jgi:hypothetical protein
VMVLGVGKAALRWPLPGWLGDALCTGRFERFSDLSGDGMSSAVGTC